ARAAEAQRGSRRAGRRLPRRAGGTDACAGRSYPGSAREARRISVIGDAEVLAASVDALVWRAQSLHVRLGGGDHWLEPRMRLPYIGDVLVLVDARELALLLYDLAIDHNEVDLAAAGRVDKLIDRAVEWREGDAVEPIGREVGDASLADRAEFTSTAERLRPTDSGETEGIGGPDPRLVVALQLLQQRGKIKGVLHICPLDRAAAISAHADVDATVQQRPNGREARADLEVGAGVVLHSNPGLGQDVDLARVEPDTVDELRVRLHEADRVQVLDHGRAIPELAGHHLHARLLHVDHQRQVEIIRHAANRLEELLSATLRRRGGGDVADTFLPRMPFLGEFPGKAEQLGRGIHRRLVKLPQQILGKFLLDKRNRSEEGSVKEREADVGADADVLIRLEHCLDMIFTDVRADVHVVEDRRRAGVHGLDGTDHRTQVDLARREIDWFERADIVHPELKRQVVFATLVETLVTVVVTIDEPGRHQSPAEVDHSAAWLPGARRADLPDH